MFEVARLNEPAILSHHRLRLVQCAMQADLSQPITLTSAARLAGLEPHYFCALFHALAGVRFMEWVTHVRIRAAQELLIGSGERITDIALIVGYNDLRSFERAFQRHSGTTPAQFRRTSHAPALLIPDADRSVGSCRSEPERCAEPVSRKS